MLLAAGCGDGRADRELAAAIDAQLEPHVQRGDLSGAVVAGRGDRVAYARGFHLADAENRIPFTPETPAPVGALAETLTAAAVWLLAGEGRLELDAPVQRYLPRFPWPEPTLRQLLSRAAGLPDREALAAELRPGEEWSGARVVELLRRGGFEPRHAPGAALAGGGLGHDLLAHVVEEVEGRSFAAFVQERLLDRLGIEVLGRGAGVPPRALGYRREGAWLKPDPLPASAELHGGGGLYLSALDLFRWCSSFYADPGLREETLERGSRPATIGGRPAAMDQLGWTAAAGGRRYRAARLRGHTTFAYRDDRRRHAVVFVSNTSMPIGLQPRLERALVRVLEGGPAEAIAVPERAPLEPGDLAAAAGAYALPVLGRLELGVIGPDELEARVGDGPRYRVRPAGEGRLHVSGLDAWLAFSAPGDGSFGRVHWTSVFSVAEGERVAAPEEPQEEVP